MTNTLFPPMMQGMEVTFSPMLNGMVDAEGKYKIMQMGNKLVVPRDQAYSFTFTAFGVTDDTVGFCCRLAMADIERSIMHAADKALGTKNGIYFKLSVSDTFSGMAADLGRNLEKLADDILKNKVDA